MRYFLFFTCVIISLWSCTQRGRVLPPLNESYRKTDKRPFGSFIAYKEFKNVFNDRYVETVTDPFDDRVECN